MTSLSIAGNDGFSSVFSNQVAGITDYLNNAVNISNSSATENAFNYTAGPIYVQTRPDLLKTQVLYTPIEFSNAVSLGAQADPHPAAGDAGFALLTAPNLNQVTTNFSTNNTCFTFPNNAVILKVTIETSDGTPNGLTGAGATFISAWTNSNLQIPADVDGAGTVALNLQAQTPIAAIQTLGGASTEVGGGPGCSAPTIDGSGGLDAENLGTVAARDDSGLIGGPVGDGQGLSPYDGSWVSQDDLLVVAPSGPATGASAITSGGLKVTVWWYDVDPLTMRVSV